MATTVDLPTLRSEAVKRRQLVVTRRQAGAMLAAASVVFAVTTAAGGEGWLSYIQATAEASMVGGLADWFAVTALFRHPLGIPIPHTAIIPERKDQFGETLGSFVQDSFLTPTSIIERVRASEVGRRLAEWLAKPANARRLAGHVVDAGVAMTDLLRDDEVQRVVESAVRERIDATPLAPLAGRVLDAVTADGRHRQLIDAALKGLDRYLDEHRDELHSRFSHEAPWWLPGAVEDRIFDRLLDGARAVLDRAAHDPDDELRAQLDARIRQLAVDLQTSPDLRERGEQLKQDLLSQPQLREWVASLWEDAKRWLREQAADPESRLRSGVADAICSAGAQLRDDPVLATKVQEGIEGGARYVAEHFHGEIGTLVSSTIERWDGEETSRRLELLLGRDLQFIRINGTVVGGMAGLALHTISQALT